MSDKRERLLVVAGVVVRDGRVMLCQRRPEVHNGLKWEFPGGKLEPGESPEAALRRELREELSIDVRVGSIADAVYYRYPDRDVLLLFYMCEITAGEPAAVDCNAVEWPGIGEVPRYDFAGADRVFVERNLKTGDGSLCFLRRGGDAPPAHEVRCMTCPGGRPLAAPTTE